MTFPPLTNGGNDLTWILPSKGIRPDPATSSVRTDESLPAFEALRKSSPGMEIVSLRSWGDQRSNPAVPGQTFSLQRRSWNPEACPGTHQENMEPTFVTRRCCRSDSIASFVHRFPAPARTQMSDVPCSGHLCRCLLTSQLANLRSPSTTPGEEWTEHGRPSPGSGSVRISLPDVDDPGNIVLALTPMPKMKDCANVQ